MKDYYYILGIKQNASTEEIKTAYRKLSLKFHPDVNKGDDFFTERFKEIQEAYETLLNNTSRSNYDNIKSNRPESGQPDNKPNFIPYIEYFKSNKLSFEFDEEITFSWKSINSDRVTIKPFGIVPPIGQKTYKLKNFKDATLIFELIAENLNINKTAKSTLVLKNKTYQDLYNHFKNEIEKDISRSSSKSHEHKENYNNNQNTNEKHKNSFSEYLKRRGQKIVAEVEILNGKKLVFCLPIDTHNSIVEGCEVYINEKNALDGIYKSKNNKRYEVEKGLLKDEFLIEIFKQNNGTEIEIDYHRMRGIAKGSRVWLNDYPAPNGTYKKGILSKVQVIDGKIEKIL